MKDCDDKYHGYAAAAVDDDDTAVDDDDDTAADDDEDRERVALVVGQRPVSARKRAQLNGKEQSNQNVQL